MTERRPSSPSPILVDRRTALRGALAGGAAFAWPGLVHAAPQRGGTLRVAIAFNPSSLDPSTGRNAPDLVSLFALYDGLIEADPLTLDLKPGLAKAWHFSDPQTLVLDLVEGVSFQDGTPFDAEAVKFNFDRARSDPRSSIKSNLESIDSVSVNGKTQVVAHLKRPNAALPTILSERAGLMVSPKAVQANNGNIDRSPVGTGAWKLVTWRDNDRLILRRNENYWRPGLPHLDGVELTVINEAATALRSVVAGDQDLALNLRTAQKPIADRAKNVVSLLTPSIGLFTIYLNYSRPPLDDVRVRQALNYAIDRDALNRAVSLGLDQPTSAVLPKQHWACDPSTANFYNYDPQKARKLLADAGHLNGIEIPMVGWSDQASMQRHEVIMAQLAKAGIRIQLTPASAAESATIFFGPQKKNAGRISFWSGRPDPSQIYADLFSKNGGFNAGEVELPGFRELLEATERTNERAQRKEAFAKLQRFVIENALMVPMLAYTNLSVASPRVKDFVLDLQSKPKFLDVYLEG